MPHDEQPPGSVRSAHLATMAADHAQLSYEYLNSGDIDAYTSLFEKDAVLHRPELTIYGREELERYHQRHAGLRRYSVSRIMVSACGEHVVVIGSTTETTAGEQTGFADVFTVSSCGLFISQRAFHFALGRRGPR
ncbi:nuclear transport factor 2 family protein [Streptosporangium sp. NPDC020145]|uniref:Nuclear transport factor 2 family protein n=1 Tax=Streptosporangium jomthongense TaxID=1193683 RepID=A0ABV8FA24_9ACTN